MLLRYAGQAIVTKRDGKVIALIEVTQEARRGALRLLGVRPSYVDAIAKGVAVLGDPYPERDWMFGEDHE